jgi:broad specificity phosphatase PhoE
MTRIYLVRHAEAQGNIMRIFQGSIDADVSENGIRQLERLKEHFKNIEIDAVYSSPLIRAYKTAQAANYYHNLPITTLDDLKEIDGGHWEGVKWADIETLFRDEHRLWTDEPWNFACEGGEAMRQVYDRIWNAISKIVRENSGRRVLVTSHGCAIRNFICRASGKSIEHLREIDWFENTSVNVIDFDDNFNPNIISLNDAAHLDEETATITKQSWWNDSVLSGVTRS